MLRTSPYALFSPVGLPSGAEAYTIDVSLVPELVWAVSMIRFFSGAVLRSCWDVNLSVSSSLCHLLCLCCVSRLFLVLVGWRLSRRPEKWQIVCSTTVPAHSLSLYCAWSFRFFLCVFLNVRCQCLRRLGRTAPESFVISLFLCLSTLFASLYFSFFLRGGAERVWLRPTAKTDAWPRPCGPSLGYRNSFFLPSFPPFRFFFVSHCFCAALKKNRLLAFLVPVKSRDAVL